MSRELTQKVKNAKGKTVSQVRWLQRQLNDPFVQEAHRLGYRARSAFKLIQLDDRFHFLKPGQKIVDLGAAPGGWSQVALQRVKGGKLVAFDLSPIDPLPGAIFFEGDFLDEDAPGRIKEALNGPADVVLSDMAPLTTGHSATDHLRIINLVEAAFLFATEILNPGGTFVAKVFQGGAEHNLLKEIKLSFAVVRHAKPPASRAESAETYLIASGFRHRS